MELVVLYLCGHCPNKLQLKEDFPKGLWGILESRYLYWPLDVEVFF